MAIKRSKKTKIRNSKKNSKTSKIPESQYREILGIIFFILAFSIFFILFKNPGIAGEYINNFLRLIFGFGAFVLPFIFILIGGFLFFVNHFKFTFYRIFGFLLSLIGILTIITLSADFDKSFKEMEEFGGVIGFTFSYILKSMLGETIAYLVSFGLIFLSIPLVSDMSIKEIFQKIFKPLTETKKIDNYDFEEANFSKSKNKTEKEIQNQIEEIKAVEFQEQNKIDGPTVSIIKPKQIEINSKNEEENEEKNNEKNEIEEAKVKKQIENILPKKIGIKVNQKNSQGIRISNFTGDEEWELPSLGLLENKLDENYPDDDKLKKQALNIKTKLSQFGIEVEVIEARVGPTVTQFTLNPAEGVKVSKILGLKDDLAMALASKAVRIEAPIPGQPYVGIEIPNEKRSTVFMKEIIQSKEFLEGGDSKLKLCFGKDTSGNSVVEDLGKMPHMLIAGTTGSGKSVGMNTFLISLMYQNSPKELKFIMIDPKMVELSGYNGCPHLLTPVITDADKALASLKWSVSEMMRRYTECKDKGYRNIQEYNKNEKTKMPKIVIVIDELADLMMREYKKETETAIARIAQMARAVGMHLIIATQRPTVDVITGLIKANIPTRISFAVKSSIDSRTVLDSMGGEDLLGMGDMMYINSSLPKPKRVQGIFISTKEIERVVNHIKLAKEPENEENEDLEYQENIIGKTVKVNGFEGNNGGTAGVGEIDLDAIAKASSQDEKVGEAIAIIQKTGKASATLLQRMIGVGYARAAKILDILEEQGVVGPSNGAKPREVYLEKISE